MSKKKFGHKLGGSFAPLLSHTRKSAAWQRLSVGARALFMELQSRYYLDREGYVFLSSRDGARCLCTRPHNILRWLDELEHYGFLVKLCGPHLGVDGDGQSAHYRLTDRWFHGQAPTRDFEKWSGEIFASAKRVYSDAEKARLNGLKKYPVTRSDTPRDTVGHIRAGAKKPPKRNKCDTVGISLVSTLAPPKSASINVPSMCPSHSSITAQLIAICPSRLVSSGSIFANSTTAIGMKPAPSGNLCP
jgi:hypothetical protein